MTLKVAHGAVDYRSVLVDILGGPRRGGPRYCDICAKATTGGKPFCHDHVLENPYAAQLVAVIADREQEIAEITTWGERGVRSGGTVLADVLHHLGAHGPCTLSRLAYETGLPFVVVEACAKWLRRNDLVALGETKRGNTTLRLAS